MSSHRLQQRGLTWGILFLIATSCSLAALYKTPVPRHDQPGRQSSILLTKLNPNTAPWWELTALPRIGPQTAMTIASWREERVPPAFHSLQDLDQIQGIGPVTLKRISSYVRFPDTEIPSESVQPGKVLR